MIIDVRELDPPIYPELIRKYRGSRRGIQLLADLGHDPDKILGYTRTLDTVRANANARAKTGEQRQARNIKKTLSAEDIPFIAWDGEGWSDTDMQHRYNYMANSLGEYLEYPMLSTIGCLNFLLNTASRCGKVIHVIYGMGYDVTHWLRDMPQAYRRNLKELGKVAWLDYVITYIPNKWFELKGYAVDEQGHSKKQRVVIYDVMTFFQTSFIKALESRGLEVPEEVTIGKASRSQFSVEDMPAIKVYTGHELRLLVELCNKLRDEFREAGMPVRRYYGPGAVANEVMRMYGVSNHMSPAPTEPVDIELLCCKAYFGGRFEPMQIGHYEGTVYQADICSAYPDKIRLLPSLKNSHWEYRDHYTGELGIWRCSYQGAPGWKAANPVPWRARDGSVGFPRVVDEVWLWSFEAQYVDPHDGWVLVIEDSDLPFHFIPGMYDTRKAWKAAGKGGHWALKLALNSLYGKMAQRVGGKDGMPPKYHQLAWAGMVTSMTRAQLWRAMSLKPEAVIAVETDSVMTTEKLDLDYGAGLGQWELSEYQWVTYLQSGVYWSDTGPKIKAKTRGVSPSELSHDSVMVYLSGDQSEPLVMMVHRFISLNNPQVALYGQWEDANRELHVNSEGGKRWHLPALCDACGDGKTMGEALHRMVAAPTMGRGPSKAHPLPWRVDIVPNDVPVDMGELDWTYEL